MLVRKAKSEDLNSILQFQLAMAKETESIELDKATVQEGVTAVLEDSTKGYYYVAENENKIIASLLTTFEWSDWRNGTVLWIQSVYVVPEFRRKGIYSKLYEHIKTLVLADPTLKGIRLYADVSNIAAHNTYQKLGMTPDHYLTFEWLK
jgi:predicted GNAT family acetyltransferase